jgi:diphthamide biosynthesis methyltransferase
VRYGVSEIIEADRELVESGCEEMLDRAKDQPSLAMDEHGFTMRLTTGD